MRARSILLTAVAALLLGVGAVPASAGALVELDGVVLRYAADDVEPHNVTIDRLDGVVRLDENASRMWAGTGCTVSDGGYRVECPDTRVERIEVRLGLLGSDVRILADLPSIVHGGPGDDLIVGGPAEDAIDGGPGQDILAGGLAADLLEGGPDKDLVTYEDTIDADGELLPRRTPVHVEIGRPNASGGRDERDTIESDVEQLLGGAGADTFALRDGRATEISCGDGRDVVTADPRDVLDIDCESAHVAPPRGGTPLSTATLAFPFPGVNDAGRSSAVIDPILPLSGNAITLRVSCPAGLGLLELVRALPCTGKVRFTRSDGVAMGVNRVLVPRGGARTLQLPLTSSRALARRTTGLTLTATALPDRGDVQRSLRFTVKG